MNNCLNCGYLFEGRYCSKCGQPSNTDKLQRSDLLYDLRHFLHLDDSFFRTLYGLLSSPGKFIFDYLKGKRKSFFGPLSTFLTITGIFILLYAIGNIDPLNVVSQMVYVLNNFLYGEELAIPAWILENYAAIELLIVLPLFCIASFLVFYKARYSFTEHIVINAFLSAQRMLIGILTFPILLVFKEGDLSYYIQILIGIAELMITIWAYMTFFIEFKRGQRIVNILLVLFLVFVQLLILMYLYPFIESVFTKY